MEDRFDPCPVTIFSRCKHVNKILPDPIRAPYFLSFGASEHNKHAGKTVCIGCEFLSKERSAPWSFFIYWIGNKKCPVAFFFQGIPVVEKFQDVIAAIFRQVPEAFPGL
jgi:hypothetical protein